MDIPLDDLKYGLRVVYKDSDGIIFHSNAEMSTIFYPETEKRIRVKTSSIKWILYEVDIYNIRGTNSGKIDLRYKRVSEYAELNKLERDILNLIDFGFFTLSDDEMTAEDKERDMIAKRRLRVTNGLVDIETIDNHIENVKNKSKKYITKGNDEF